MRLELKTAMRHTYYFFRFVVIAGLMMSVCAVPLATIAQIGVRDQTFGEAGKVQTNMDYANSSATSSYINSMAEQADGKIIAVGSLLEAPGSGSDFGIARYNINGSVDSSFGNHGFVVSDYNGDTRMISVVIQPDGKIVCGGGIHFPSPTVFYLIRLKVDGSYDSTFGNNGKVITSLDPLANDVLFKIVLLGNGKIVAAGLHETSNNRAIVLVQYNPNGTVDSSFGNNGSVTNGFGNVQVYGGLAVQTDGKIVVANGDQQGGSTLKYSVARFNSNGITDSSFGVNGVFSTAVDGYAYDLALQKDNKIVLVGSNYAVTGYGQLCLARITTTGILDSSFGGSGIITTRLINGSTDSDIGASVLIQPDGKILATATTSILTNRSKWAVARYKPNGKLDNTFGRRGIVVTNLADYNNNYHIGCNALLIQKNGKIVVGGYIALPANIRDFCLVRYEQNAKLRYNTVKGSVFIDANYNGIKEATEPYYGNLKINAVKAGVDSFSTFSSSGKFSIDIDSGAYVLRPVSSPYYNIVPTSYTIAHPDFFNSDSISFALQPIPGSQDNYVYIIPTQRSRIGFSTQYHLIYGNRGMSVLTNGMVEMVLDKRVIYNAAVPAPSSISGDTLRWNNLYLDPGQNNSMDVTVTLKTPPILNLNDTLHYKVSFYPIVNDLVPGDNVAYLHQKAISSFDPNDKNENHGGVISLAEIASGDYLQYIIWFQNTGTDTAYNVYLRDTLDSKLDWSTFEMIGASADYQMTVEHGICNWTFSDINLVDSFANEPGSHGYVVYRIKPKATLAIGDNVNNSAGIYFDYNLPVITNLCVTKVVANALPLRLLSFAANAHNKTNLLQWVTAREVNTAYFAIERSADGKKYAAIGKVAAGTNNYSYTDEHPLRGYNYYRLKMVDKDGRFTYSDVRLVNQDFNGFSLYPNPAHDHFVISGTNLQWLTIADLAGHVVKQQMLGNVAFANISLDGLAKGVYMVQVGCGGMTGVVRVVRE